MANLDGLKPNLVAFYNDLKQAVPEATITSGKRNQAIGTAGNASHHLKGGAMDFGADPKVGAFLSSQKGQALLSKYGLGYLDETTKEALAKTGGTGKHYHVGEDSRLVAKTKASQYQAAQPEINTDFSQPTLNAKYAPVALPDFSTNSPSSIFGNKPNLQPMDAGQASYVNSRQQMLETNFDNPQDFQSNQFEIATNYQNDTYQPTYQEQQNINISPIGQSVGNTEQIRQYLTDLWDNTDISKEEYMNG